MNAENKVLIKELEGYCQRIFKPRPRLTVTQWAEQNLVLSERSTNIPGPYSTRLTPYVCEPLECFGNDSIRDLCLCWGAQTSKTMTIMAGVSYRVDIDPAPVLWIMPSESLCRSFTEARWIPLIEDCEKLAAHKPTNSDKFKLLEQHFDRMTVKFVGSNSPGNLSSFPIAIVIADEADKFAEATSKEAAAIQLADVRTITYQGRALRVKTSTPTVPQGTIWQEFQKGDRRFYFVPCPHCSEFITFTWAQVWWDPASKDENGQWDLKKVRSSASYKCQQCGETILDGHKTKMLRAGQWRPTNPNAEPRRRSYHLNSIYAPWVTFGELACKFLEDKQSLMGLQDFVNSKLAEPWEENHGGDQEALITTEYSVTDKWEEESQRFFTIDKQKDHYWGVIRAWAKGGASRLIWEGQIKTYEEIHEIQNSHGVTQRRVLIDSGYMATEVYEQCIKYGWTALKGEDKNHFLHILNSGMKVSKLYSTLQRGDPGIGTREQGKRYAQLFLFSTNGCKDWLSRLRRGLGPKWEIPKNISKEYEYQIDSETKKKRFHLRTGKEIWEWVRVGKRPNHLFDCEVMQVAAAIMAGLIERVEKSENEVST